MLKKLVTVISLSYNNADTIYAAIDSVLQQDYTRLEYIVIDDGSTDFDKNAIENYICSHNLGNIESVMVLVNSCNIGTIKTLNRAIKQANGEIIFNLASDDSFVDGKVISEWVEVFERNEADVVSAIRAVYTNGKFLFEQPTLEQRDLINTGGNKLFERLAPMNFIYGSNTARTRKSFEKYGFYDEQYRLIEDYSSTLRLIRNGAKFYCWDRVVINYNLGGVSESSKVDRYYLNENKAIFKNEALPFVKNKFLAKKSYKNWLCSVKVNRYKVLYINSLERHNITKYSFRGNLLKLLYLIRFMPYTLIYGIEKAFRNKDGR